MVKTAETSQQLLTQGHLFCGWQNGAGKAAARKLLQQVHPHITPRADIPQKAMAAAQQHGLAEGSSIGEFGKVEIDARHAMQVQCGQVGIVTQSQHTGLRRNTGHGHVSGCAGVDQNKRQAGHVSSFKHCWVQG